MFFRNYKRKLIDERNKNLEKDIIIKEMRTKISVLKEEKAEIEAQLEEAMEENYQYHETFKNMEKILKQTKYGTYKNLLDFKNKIKIELSQSHT